jgi:hypothetical protein
VRNQDAGVRGAGGGWRKGQVCEEKSGGLCQMAGICLLGRVPVMRAVGELVPVFSTCHSVSAAGKRGLRTICSSRSLKGDTNSVRGNWAGELLWRGVNVLGGLGMMFDEVPHAPLQSTPPSSWRALPPANRFKAASAHAPDPRRLTPAPLYCHPAVRATHLSKAKCWRVLA